MEEPASLALPRYETDYPQYDSDANKPLTRDDL